MPTLRLNRNQTRNCDQVAINFFHIPSIILMENAGIAAANAACNLIDNDINKNVAIVAGVGNNAGDGFVVARKLANLGIKVDIFIAGLSSKYVNDALTNFIICKKMALPIHHFDPQNPQTFFDLLQYKLISSDLIVDALLGTGSSGPAREPVASTINIINQSGRPILALDIPSGLDCDTGLPLSQATIKASHTITFLAEKTGFQNHNSKLFTGDISVADIGIRTDLLTKQLNSL